MPGHPGEVKPGSEAPQAGPGSTRKPRLQPMPWLKLWTDILVSPKLWRVTEALRARWFFLCAIACKFDRNGLLPDVEDIAFYLRLDIAKTTRTLEELRGVQLLDLRGKRYSIHDWADWQSARSPVANRQGRYRERLERLPEDDSPGTYEEYLASEQWQARAEAAKEAAGQRCQVCNAHRHEITLDTHHRTYERLGHEDPGDLVVLCRRCHDLFHDAGWPSQAETR